jgi:hypothetical protein
VKYSISVKPVQVERKTATKMAVDLEKFAEIGPSVTADLLTQKLWSEKAMAGESIDWATSESHKPLARKSRGVPECAAVQIPPGTAPDPIVIPDEVEEEADEAESDGIHEWDVVMSSDDDALEAEEEQDEVLISEDESELNGREQVTESECDEETEEAEESEDN